MVKKLDNSELKNVSGGGCGDKHVLQECDITITYRENGLKQHQMIVELYQDTRKDVNNDSYVTIGRRWCEENHKEYIRATYSPRAN